MTAPARAEVGAAGRSGPWNAVFHLARLVLGGVYLYAAVLKIVDLESFAESVANYHVLPHALNYLVAATLPWIEALAGLLLLVGRKVRPATVVLGGLTLVFIGLLVSAMVRGLDIDCGCFGKGDYTPPIEATLRDVGLLALAAVIWWRAPRR